MTLLCRKVMVLKETYCPTANGSDITELPPKICAVFKKRLKECAECQCSPTKVGSLEGDYD